MNMSGSRIGSSSASQTQSSRWGERTGRSFVEKFRHQLNQDEVETVLENQDRDTFQQYLTNLLEKHQEPWLKKTLEVLEPYFGALERFSRALDMVFSADRSASLAWGITRIIIQIGVNAMERMRKVSDYLIEVGRILDELVRTEQTFPNHLKLHEALSIAHDNIMQVYLGVLRYLRKPPLWKRLVMSPFRNLESLQQDFAKLKSNVEHVVFETRLVGYECLQPRLRNQRIFYVPYSWNSDLFSRESILKRLDSSFESPASPTSGCRVVCLHGTGGVGKSMIAFEYTHTRRSKFDWIVWVPADTEEKLSNSFREIAKHLELQDAGLSERDLVSAVKIHLSSAAQSWLLVFDDVNDLRILEKYWPTSGNGNIILTTHDCGARRFSSESIHIDKLTPEEGINFLKLFAPEIDPKSEAVKQLVHEVGALPIGLHHVARRLQTTGSGMSIEDILKQYRDPAQTQVLFEIDEGMPGAQRAAIGKIWEPAYIKLKSTNERAAYALQCLAWVDHDGLPESVFQNSNMFPTMALYHSAIEALTRSSLATQDTRCLWVHRLVQLTTINRMSQKERAETFSFTVMLLEARFPKPYYDPREAVFPGDMGNMEACRTLVPHVLSLVKNHEKYLPHEKTERFGSLLQRAAFYLMEIDNKQGEKLLRLSLGMNWTGERHILGHIQMSLAWNLMRCGSLRQAREIGSQSIVNFETSIGKEHVLTAWSYCNFGRILTFNAEFMEAHRYYQRAIEIYEEDLKSDPENTDLRHGLLMARNYLATLLHCQLRGDIFGDIYEPSIAGSLTLVVPTLGDEEKLSLQEPLEHCKAGLDLSNTIYKSRLKSQTLAWIELTLGWILLDLGRLDEAEMYNLQAINDVKIGCDPEGCGVGVLTVQKADILNAQGKPEDAEKEYMNALDLLKRKMGLENPLTALSYHKTGNFYCRNGRFSEAIPYYQLALESFTNSYGESHSSTATTMNNLGVALINVDKRAEGMEFLKRALEVRKTIFKPSHKLVTGLTTNVARITLYLSIGLKESSIKEHSQPLYIKDNNLIDGNIGGNHLAASTMTSTSLMVVESIVRHGAGAYITI